MSVQNIDHNSSYGFNNPLQPVINPPIIANRAPEASDLAEIGSQWIDQSTGDIYFLTRVLGAEATWVAAAGNGAVLASLTVDPGPIDLTGDLTVNGDNVNISATADLNITGTNTTDSSLTLTSTDGGVEIGTDAAAKDVALFANAGSITMVAGENVQDAIVIQADGGTSSGLLIENTSGTGGGSATASAIGILATGGAVYIESQDSFSGAVVLDASDAAGGVLINSGSAGTALTSTGNIAAVSTLGNIDLTADAGDVNIVATAGAIDFTAGSGLNWNVTGAINLDATATSHFIVTGAAEDLNLESTGGSVNIIATEVATDAIVINASSGGMNLSAVGAASLVTTGGSHDINIQATSSKVTLNAGNPSTDAIVLSANGAGAGIEIAPDATTIAVAIADVTPTVNRTTVINGHVVNAAHSDTVNIATGGVSTNAGASKVVNIASDSNLLGTTTVNIATGTAASGTKAVNIGNADALTQLNAIGVIHLNATNAGATTIGNTVSGTAVALNSTTTITSLAPNVNINNSGTGATTIGSTATGTAVAINSSSTVTALAPNVNINNSGTGATTVGSATGGTFIVESNTATANAIQLNAHNAAGGITATVGTNNFNVTGGNIVIPTAGKGLTLTPAPATPASFLAGSGDPNAVVTAGQGSIYLNVAGNANNNRAFINTDGGTTWTAVTTVS